MQISSQMTYREIYDVLVSILRKCEDYLTSLKADLPHTISLSSFQVIHLKEGPDQAKQIENNLKLDKKDTETMTLSKAVVLDKKSENITHTLREAGIHLEGNCAFIVEIKRWEGYFFEVEIESKSDDDDYFGVKTTNHITVKNKWTSSYRKDSDHSSAFPYKESVSKMGVVGLKNLGNTCYMNSALQCLSNCKELSEYFLKGEFKQDENHDNVLGSKCKLVEAYAGLINKMWYGEEDKVSPYDFKYEMGSFQSAVWFFKLVRRNEPA